MTNSKNTRALLGAIATLGLAGLYVPSVYGVTYTLAPNDGTTAQDWNTAATWTPSTGTPSSGDTATVSGAFGGVSQTVDISAALGTGLTTLVLGDTSGTGTTTVRSNNATPLAMASASASITSGGLAGAVNVISAPLALNGGLTINGPGSTVVSNSNNPLSIAGKISPVAAGAKTIDNLSTQTVTFGDIDLSTGATASTVTIRAGTTALATGANSNVVLGGVIADGGTVASNIALGARYSTTLGGSSFQINGTNTYTGTTTLGLQANVNTVFKINSDQPFGPASGGTLTIGNNTYANTLEAVGQDRTISKNSTTINRSIVFQGSNSLTLAATTMNMSNNASTSNSTIGVFAFINNNITASGKTVTLGSSGGNLYLNGSNTSDLYRMRDVTGAGTTIIASNMADNSGASVPADSRMVIQQSGTGTLILAGNNTYQGSTRITGTGTIQLGNGGTTGSLAPAHDSDATKAGVDSIAIVNGTGSGTLAFNRSDAFATTLTANGAIGLAQKGAGAVTLSNAQFNSGANTIGDGVSPSTLVVNGGRISSVGTTGANVSTLANGQLAVTTVTLTGADTTASLNLKVGQPVYVTGSPSAVAYVDAILTATTFRVGGQQSSTTAGALAAGSGQSLTFGEGSALGTSAAVTTVNNLGTLAGTGSIAGQVNALSGSFLSPGATDGAAGTLTTGGLSLTGATLKFDLAATAAGASDQISSTGSVSFSSLTFDFNPLTAGVLETGSSYHLLSFGGSLTGNPGLIGTNFGGSLQGLYVPFYSVDGSMLNVTFAAVPEPASFGLLAGMAALGGCLVRRRRRA